MSLSFISSFLFLLPLSGNQIHEIISVDRYQGKTKKEGKKGDGGKGTQKESDHRQWWIALHLLIRLFVI